MEKIPERKDIEEKYKWKLEDMIPGDDAWESMFANLSKEYSVLGTYKGKVSSSSKELYEYLKKMYEISLTIEKLYVYAKMRRDEDNNIQKYQDMFMRGYALETNISAITAFFTPEIIAMGKEKVEYFLNECAELKEYSFVLEDILRAAPHTLSAQEEEIIARASQALSASGETFTMLTNTEMKFPKIKVGDEKVPLTEENYVSFIRNKDVNVRKAAFKALFTTYKSYKNTIASCFAGNLSTSNFYAQVGKYKNARAMYLFGDDVPDSVYDNLIKTIDKNLNVLGEYLELRKKVLGEEKIHMYDLYVPIAENDEKKYTYEEAKEIVLEALKPMGEEYLKVAREGLEGRWTDVCATKGKTSGAYSWGCYGCHPYMLLNWQGTINDVFTLIHELGHSMHTYYSNKYQPYQYSQYAIFAAEVASTVNENLLIRYMLSQKDANKPYLINHFLEEFRTTVFRQTMFAEFEYKAHSLFGKNGAVTGEELDKLYLKINRKYYGKHVTVDKLISYEWMRIPHFYSPFYVYKYATGFSCAVAFSKMILDGNKDGYMEFLKSGGSDHPMNLLKKAGVDLNTPAPIENAMGEFEKYVKELEKLI